MDVENNIDENVKEMLQSEDLSQQIEAINILLTENVDEDSVRYIAGLINDKDKGVRNAAANFKLNLYLQINVINSYSFMVTSIFGLYKVGLLV